jgi:murein DD-endopeptidase MepM/ murein hydrolase activator NlpD
MKNSKCKMRNLYRKTFNFARNPAKAEKFLIIILHFAFLILNCIGCAPITYVKPTAPTGMPGIYHRVEKGQTLWRISKIYSVDLNEISEINHISDAANIEVGQLIFIPNRHKQQSLPATYSSDDFIWPVRGRVIASFGQTFNNMINKGINIQPYNNLNVVAARSGKVIFYSDNFGHFGKTIVIEHGEGFSTVYARNSQAFIKAGDSVEKGAVIAKAGLAGEGNNMYLHFEIRKGHIPQNPKFYLPPLD